MKSTSNAGDITARNAVAVALRRMLWRGAADIGSLGILGSRFCQLATLEHFTRLEQLMADQHSVHIGHDDMMSLVHDVGGIVDAQRKNSAKDAIENPLKIEAKVHPKQVYVSCDGIMYCTNEREPCLTDPQKKRLLWRQMRVGCVYWQDEKEHWQKQVIWGQEDLPTFAASLFQLACEHGYREAEEQIFMADGGEWCWGIQDKYFAGANRFWTGITRRNTCGRAGKFCVRRMARRSRGAMKLWSSCEAKGEGLSEWLQPQLTGLRGEKRNAKSDEFAAGIFLQSRWPDELPNLPQKQLADRFGHDRIDGQATRRNPLERSWHALVSRRSIRNHRTQSPRYQQQLAQPLEKPRSLKTDQPADAPSSATSRTVNAMCSTSDFVSAVTNDSAGWRATV